MGLFKASSRPSGDDSAHTVKPAGKRVWECRTGPTMHQTQGEWRLGQLAGADLRAGERPAMDRNRRP